MSDKIRKDPKKPWHFRFWVRVVKIFYRKRTIEGIENLPDEPCVIVANHAQIHSPITFEGFFPGSRAIWCDSKMMEKAEIPNYAEEGFWPNATDKQKKRRRFWMKKIAGFAEYLLTTAHTIPVYRDMRVMKTFKLTEEALREGKNIIIFPENEVTDENNPILDYFNLYFVDIAKIYYKKHGKILTFVPCYNCVELKRVVIGKNHVKYNPDIKMDEQREILCEALRKEITDIALSLPRHKVVPFIATDHDVYSKDE